MSTTVVIDLGDDWSVAGDPPPRPRRPPARGPLTALLLVAVLLLAGGAAGPQPAFVPLVTIAAQGVSSIDVGGDGLFVGQAILGQRFVARYALHGGRQTWGVTVPNVPQGLLYLAGADALMVQTFNNENNEDHFTVLDAATGRELWSSTGNLVWAPSPTAAPSFAQGLLISEDPGGTTQLRYTDMRTGRPIWTRPFPSATRLVAEQAVGSDSAFVLAAADGTVTLLGRAAGEVLATRQIGRIASDPGTFDPEYMTTFNGIGNRLVVMRQEGVLANVSTYDLPGLTLRWSLTAPLSGYPSDCGPVLCLSDRNGELVALDLTDGSTRWHSPGWQGASDLGGGRLLAYRATTNAQAGVLDAATGRTLVDLVTWTTMSGSGADVLLTAPDRDYRYTWFALLDAERGVVRPLGRLADVSTQGCDAHGEILVCRTFDARLRVWRYRR